MNDNSYGVEQFESPMGATGRSRPFYRRRRWLLTAFLLLLPLAAINSILSGLSGAAAGAIFADSGQELVSLQGNNSQDVGLGDLDGDGTIDAFVVQGGSGAQDNVIWLNDGLAVFSESVQFVGGGDSRGVALGDLDNDGDLDAYIANAGSVDASDDEVWINQGGDQGGAAGEFTRTQLLSRSGYLQSYGVALGDLDQDTDLDALVIGSEPHVWINGGGGDFTPGPIIAGIFVVNDVSLGDLDKDGDLDVILAREGSFFPSQVWLNDWNGITLTFSAGPALQTDGVNSGVGVADLDGDTNLDIFIASSAANRVWWNQWNGLTLTFTSTATFGGQNDSDVALANLDGINGPDVFVTRQTGGKANGVWLNEGSRSFTSTADALGNFTSLAVELADLDGDNDLDAFVANSGPNKVWLNQLLLEPPEPGQFFDSGRVLSGGTSDDVALGNLDGDGDLDVVIAQGSYAIVSRNDGDGGFTSVAELSGGEEVELADVDGDGHLDVVLNGTKSIWLNDGNAGFSRSAELPDFLRSKTLGDVDNDGDLDIVTSRPVTQDVDADTRGQLWLNTGGIQLGTTGVFTDSGQRLWISDGDERPLLRDLDGDGDLDIFLSRQMMREEDFASTVWLNQGGNQGGTIGVFADSGQRIGNGLASQVALGDVDGDGDWDAFLAQKDRWTTPVPNQIWLNQGGIQAGDPGTFADSGQALGNAASQGVVLGDVDGDGDLDAFVANATINRVWLNQGGLQNGNEGTFADSGQQLGSLKSAAVALGDLDGDSDLDALVANSGPDRVWLNGETTLLPAVSIGYNLLIDGSDSFVLPWWDRTNASVPVVLSRIHNAAVDVLVRIDWTDLGDDSDQLSFQPGDVVHYPTLGAGEPGGEPEKIWNPYLGISPNLGPEFRSIVHLEPGDEGGVLVSGVDVFKLIFFDPDSTIRECFLEGMAFMLGLFESGGASGRATGGLLTAAAQQLSLDLFFDLRDQVMANTPQGRYYTDLYYRHSTELLQITAQNAWLIEPLMEAIDTWRPALQALVDGQGDGAIITKEMIDQANYLLEAYHAEASPELKAAIRQEAEILDLESFIGLDMDEALAKVKERPLPPIFLPIVNK